MYSVYIFSKWTTATPTATPDCDACRSCRSGPRHPMLSVFPLETASIDTHANDSRSLNHGVARSALAAIALGPGARADEDRQARQECQPAAASARPSSMTTPRNRPNLPSRVRKPFFSRPSPRRTASRSRERNASARLRAEPPPRVSVPVPRAAIGRTRPRRGLAHKRPRAIETNPPMLLYPPTGGSIRKTSTHRKLTFSVSRHKTRHDRVRRGARRGSRGARVRVRAPGSQDLTPHGGGVPGGRVQRAPRGST